LDSVLGKTKHFDRQPFPGRIANGPMRDFVFTNICVSDAKPDALIGFATSPAEQFAQVSAATFLQSLSMVIARKQ